MVNENFGNLQYYFLLITACQPNCVADLNQYEYSQCTATQNRKCEDRAILPPPVTSANVFLEDLPAVEDVVEDATVGFQGSLSFHFRRGNYKRGITGR